MRHTNKIIFVGDTHLTANTPSSRKETNEEYRNLQITKLKYIYENLAGSDDIVVILGDVFHSSALSVMSGTPKFYNDIIDIMKSRLTMTIVGNHDLYFRNEDSYNVTILDNLFKTGVQHLTEFCGVVNKDGVVIRLLGVDYGHNFPGIPKDSSIDFYNIIVAHSFFEDDFYGSSGNSNLTLEALNLLGQYDAVVLGHDHAPYNILDLANDHARNKITKIIRPGSLLRGTSHTCHINRTPQVAVFDVNNLSWEYVPLPVAPGKEVFKEKVILEKDIDVNVQNILDNMSSFDRTVSIHKFIKSQEARGKEVFGDRYYEILKVIDNYLDMFGIIKGGN